MSRFVEKRPEVEARKFTGKSSDISAEFIRWLGRGAQVTNMGYDSLVVDVMAQDATVRLAPGDWIVRIASDEIVTTRVMSDIAFSAVYEKVRQENGFDETYKLALDAVKLASRSLCQPPVTPRGVPVTSLHSSQIRFWLNKALEKEGRPV